MAKNDLASLVKELKEVNAFAEILENDTTSEIKEWISTGSAALNAIISGDCNKGIPAGRVTTFCGLSGTGKSLVAGLISGNAQKKGYDIIWFDSEFASDKITLERLGIDASNLVKIPIATLEEFKTQVFKIISLYETKFTDRKALIVLDSLGNLASQKELDDTVEGKNAADMGLKSKTIRSIFRILTDKIGKLGIPMVCVNHTYANPGNPYAGETMSGGGGPLYISHIVASLKKTSVKDADKVVTGTILKATTIKNRVVPPFKTAEILLDFNSGMDPYYGLFDFALELGIIIKEGKRFKTIKDETLRWEKDMFSDEVWLPIIDDVNNAIKGSNKYSSLTLDDAALKELEGLTGGIK